MVPQPTTTTTRSILKVTNAGVSILNGIYQSKPFSIIPEGFSKTCNKMGWDSQKTWNQLAVQKVDWYEHENGSYIYLHNEGRWWMDDPSGGGIYVCAAKAIAQTGLNDDNIVPSTGWQPLSSLGKESLPNVSYFHYAVGEKDYL